MQKIILIIIELASLALAIQSQDFGFDNWDWWSKGKVKYSPQVVCADLDLTTIPVAVYDDFCMSFTPPQFIKFGMQPLLNLNSSVSKLLIAWDMKQTSFSGVVNIFAKNHPSVSYKKNLTLVSYLDTIRVTFPQDSTYRLYKQNSSATWHSYMLYLDSGILKFYVDGDSVYGSSVIISDPDTVFALTAFTWGSAAQWRTTDIGQIASSGTFTGEIDNIYVLISDTTVTDSVLISTHFNDGGTQQPVDSLNSYVWERSYGPHEDEQGSYLNGCYRGGSAVAVDYWDAQYQYRSGTRKDTLKYYPINDSAGKNGFRYWYSPTGFYIRAAVNKVAVNPWDSTIVGITGYFTSTRDSSIATSQGVCLLVNGAVVNLGSGLQDNITLGEMGWWVTWYNDSVLIVTHGGDSAGGVTAQYIAQVNINTNIWSNVGTPTVPAVMKCIKFQDSLWYLSGNKLLAWRGVDWVVKDSFDLTGTKTFGTITALGDDTLCVWVNEDGMYKRVGSGHTLMFASHPYTVPPAEGKGGVYYSSDYWNSSKGRLYLSGDFDSIGGVAAKNVCYYSSLDGMIHNIGTGFSGYTIARDGWYTCIATAITEWYDEQIIFAGSFRLANGVNIGSNIAMYNERNGTWCAMDYGIDWRPQGMTVYNNNGFKDLLICGDGTAAGGLSANHIFGRFSNEHFLVLIPKIEWTAIDSLLLEDYPDTLNIEAWSPAWRALTVTLIYHINYNGANDTVIMTRGDSVLNDIYGVWRPAWTGAFGGTVIANDTVFYTIHTIDNLNNSKDTSSYYKIYMTSILVDTDSLKFYAEFAEDLGLGFSTVTNNKIPSLYVDGTRNGDTLELKNGAVDSSAFGYIYFDGSNDFATFTTDFFLYNEYTIIIWFQSLSTTNGIIMGRAATTSFFWYSSVSSTMDNSVIGGAAQRNYYTSWGVQGDGDTVSVWTSANDLYRNGVLRCDNSDDPTSNLTEKFNFFARNGGAIPFKARLKRIAIYNKIRTLDEIAKWNP